MIRYIIGGGALALAGYSYFIERFALSLTRIELAYSNLPEAFDGFSILQISDLHIKRWSKIERLMEQIMQSVDYDIMVFTGDISVREKGAQLLRDFLKRVGRPEDIYGIHGNTEYKGKFGKERREDLKWIGIKLLNNKHTLLERRDDKILLVGVDDPFTYHDDLSEALSNSPEGLFKVLLAHTPDVAGEAKDSGIDLVLSGHTHGGQVRLPLLGVVYSHLHKYHKLVSGMYEGDVLSKVLKRDAGEMRVYVSRGLGVSNLPFRFLAPPEMVLFTLRKT